MTRIALIAVLAATPSLAHYGMVIPSDPMLSQEDGRAIDLTLSFSHPFEEDGMVLERPEAFTVTHEGETTDLLGELAETPVMGEPGFKEHLVDDLPCVVLA